MNRLFCFRVFAAVLLVSTSLLVCAQQPDWDKVTRQVSDSISHGALEGTGQLGLEYLPLAEQFQAHDSVRSILHFSIAIGLYRSDVKRGLLHLDSALDLSLKSNSRKVLGRIYNAQSTFHRNLGNSELAKKASLNAYHALVKHDPKNLFSGARTLSIAYRNLQEFDSALFYVLIADSLAQAGNDTTRRYLALQSATNIYLDMELYEEALATNQLLINMSNSLTNHMYDWLNLGSAYQHLGNLDSAMISYNRSLELAQQVHDTIHLANVLSRIGEVYQNDGKPQHALEVLSEALLWASYHTPTDIVAAINLAKANAHLDLNQFNRAIGSAQETLAISRDLSMEHLQLAVLDLLARIYHQAGHNIKAYDHLRLHQQLSVKLNSRERIGKIENLRTQYETTKKEQEIRDLANQNKIKDLQLQQQRLILISALAILLLTILLGFFIYKQYHSKVQQRQLYLEQNLLRTQMNPHFIFNALASIQGFITRNNRAEAATYLAKFGELTRDILEASRTDLISLSKEIEMIENYVHLEQARFSKPLDLDIRLDGIADTDDFKVPPMMIQPFLENAIKHGFKSKESGRIEVVISRTDETLKVLINDDGCGIESSQSGLGASLATKIVRERLQYLKGYAKQLFLTISNRKDEKGNILGVKVDLTLPLSHAT